jgi:hypothetical protein
VPTIGLYYPFIHFKDDDWLKLTALYWDRMARIVPPSYRRAADSEVVLERDSEVTRALADIGFIRNVAPSEVTYPVSLTWQQLLVEHAAELRSDYDVAKRGDWEPDRATAAYAQHRDPRLAYVHSSKLDETLVRQLQEERLAVAHDESGHVWAGMHPRLAGVYMSALAEEVATVNGLHPLTDETLDHVAATGWTLPRLTSALLGRPGLADDMTLDEELKASLALVSIRTVVPKDAGALTVQAIHEIRERFGKELSRLQAYIDQLGAELPKLTDKADADVIADHLQLMHKTKIEPQVEELDAQLRSAGVDLVGHSLALETIAAVEMGAEVLGLAMVSNDAIALSAAANTAGITDPVTIEPPEIGPTGSEVSPSATSILSSGTPVFSDASCARIV